MKKTAFVLLALATAAVHADDSYLYWMVNTTLAAGFSDYNGVQVKAFKSGEDDKYLTLGWNSAGTFTGINLASGLGTDYKANIKDLEDSGTGFYASLSSLGGTSGWSYMVELLKDSSVIAQSAVLSSDSAAQYIATTTGGAGLQDLAKAWSPSSYNIPEPNSALLMAIGFAALALRRRKQLTA